MSIGDEVMSLHSLGHSDRDIGERLGKSKDAIYRIRMKMARGTPSSEVREPDLEALQPIDFPSPQIPRAKYKPNPFTIVASDFHWPVSDEPCEIVFLKTVEALRPKRVVLNGDLPDMMAFSKYPKDARPGFSWKVRDEQVAMKKFLTQLETIIAPWDGELYETEANHSGNGRESRWRRWMSENAAALLEADNAEEDLSYQRYFHPRGSKIRLVEEVIVADELVITHGNMVRQKGGYTARGMSQKWTSSIMIGHTHRAGSSHWRIPAIGNRPEMLVRAYESGGMMQLEPHWKGNFTGYVSRPDWTQGFSIITHTHDDEPGRYGVENVAIHQGRADIVALGGSMAA